MYSQEIQCALCEKSSSQMGIGSTNAFGSPDLDMRPPEMQRSTITAWVQVCPECGYCAREIDKAPTVAAEVNAYPEYRRQLTNQHYPQLANAFLCLGMISERAGALLDATWACIHAAWVCDDHFKTEAAVKCRIEAVRLLRVLHGLNQTFDEQPGVDEAILTDLLRRTERFEEALDVVDKVLPNASDETIRKMFLFQKRLISMADVAAHRIGENECG